MTRPLIAIFCNSFPPEGGGASNRIYNIAVMLRDAGYRVQVVSAMPNYPTGKIFPAYRGKPVMDEVVDGIAVRRVWLSPSNTASTWGRGWSMISFVLSLKAFAFRKVRKMRPALVIVSSPPLPMAAAAVRYFHNRGCKVLLNVSDLWPLSASALGALDQRTLYSQLEAAAKRMYHAADAITAQSNETLEHIRQHCMPMPPAMLYRNLPQPSEKQKVTKRTGATEVRIIYPGLLGHAQGLLALCQAIDFRTLGARLEIYGAGPEMEAIKTFLQVTPDRGISLHTPVSPESLALKLNGASAILIPLISPIEGALPSKLFTAMQAGLPVLYSGGGEGEDIVRRYHLGWTASPGDYATIAQQIKELSSKHTPELETWGERIRAVASEHFDKEKQDAVLQQFISGIIGQQ